MPTLDSASQIEPRESLLENDLPTVACHAAIEIDNLLLDRSGDFLSVQRLVSFISESIPLEHDPTSPNWLRDPTAVAVVNRALSDAATRKPISTVDELVREAGDLLQQFRELLRNPQEFKNSHTAKLAEMKSFCLALSRRATAAKESPHNRMPEHPFRR
jgi:hypothetical protein